jgi:acyl-CoA thioesterase-1
VGASLSRIRALRGAGLPVIVLGYWNVVEDGKVGQSDYGADGAAEAALATDQANDALREAANAADAIYLSSSAALKGADNQDDPTDLLTSDGDHPNARGHEAIAQAVYTTLPDPLH